ncbi:MAG: MMPL family transporter [Ruminococcus sp.]|nr:MMPL family transporter [Candidatus Copronaster equi]
MNKISKMVVNKPKKVIIISLLLLIPALLGYIFTEVDYDILSYLPGNLNSVKGEKILSEEYSSGSLTMVIVENMTPKRVVSLKQKIEKVDNVENVIWTDNILDSSIPSNILPDEMKNVFYSPDGKYTMMFVQFSPECKSIDAIRAINKIKTVTKGECMLSGLTAISADTHNLTSRQAPIYIAIAVILAIITLLITTDSFVLPFLLVGVLGMAVLYNMGTNFILGKVSYVTQSIAAILQLGVTMDYSIFLVNRYNEEKKKYYNKKQAMEQALKGSFVSLSGSSLTTVFGFAALCFMQLSLGFNIGFVMAKGVIIGVLTVVIILPAFLLEYDEKIEKKSHKRLNPQFKTPINIAVKARGFFVVLFVLLLIPSIFLSGNMKQYYNISASLPEDLDSTVALKTMKEEFNMTTSHFILVDDSVPAKKLMKMEDEIQKVKGINSLLAYNLFVGSSIPDSIIPDSIRSLVKNGGYQLMLANSVYEAASDESNQQVAEIQNIVNKYDSNGYVTGEGALYNDLITTTKVDFIVTNIISIAAVFIVIAITFKSLSIPVILISAIELAILINESISTLLGTEIPFIAPTVVSCVQLGATVDYAILLTSRFKEEIEKGRNKIEAMKVAASQSMKSVFQSALLFFFATFGVYLVCDIEMVKSICAMLARGSIISALVILLLLIPILVVFEKLIAKTSKGWKFSGVKEPEPVSAPVQKPEKNFNDLQFEFEDTFTGFSISDDE